MRRSLLVTLAVAVTSLAPAAAQASVAGHVRVALDSNAAFPSYSTSAAHNDVVILQSWQTDRLRALKAANPAVKVLMYKNASAACVNPSASGRYACGVSAAQATANGWLLLNTSASTFSFNGYSWLMAADIGNPAYANAWADNVISELNADPWDGVFMDDVNPTIKYHYDVTAVAKYPSDSAYQGAVRTMLSIAGPKIQADGKLAVPNFGSWNSYPSVVRDWLQFTSGGMDEQFVKWGTDPTVGYRPAVDWATQVQEIRDTEAAGKLFLGVMHSANTDEQAATYGYATELLVANGHTSFTMGSDYTNETWFPEYDLPIGDPLGAETALSNGVHRRDFTNGVALVNPGTAPQTVALGSAYSGSGLTSVTSATLAPHTGLVMTRDGGPTTAAPATATTTTPAPTTTTSAPATTTSSPTTSTTTTTNGSSKPHRIKPRSVGLRVALDGRRVRVSTRCTRRCHGRIVLLASRPVARAASAGSAAPRLHRVAVGRVVSRGHHHRLTVSFVLRSRTLQHLSERILRVARVPHGTRHARPLPGRFVLA